MHPLGKRGLHAACYEELLVNPVGQIARLAAWASMDQSETLRRLDKREYFDVGHLVTRNRLRRTGNVRFSSDIKFAESIHTRSKIVVVVINGWRWILGNTCIGDAK